MTLTFNSVERLLAICFPLKFKTTKRRICYLIIMIWTTALVSKLQYPFTMETVPYRNLTKDIIFLTTCRSSWPFANPNLEVGANIADSILFFVLPFTWMLIAYSLVCRRLWHAVVPGEGGRNPADLTSRRSTRGNPVDSTLAQRRRTALMLIIIVLIFFFCNLPVHVMRVASIYISAEGFFAGQHGLKIVLQNVASTSHWICYFNSAINPIVYNFMSSRFRSEFRLIVSRCFPCCYRATSGDNRANAADAGANQQPMRPGPSNYRLSRDGADGRSGASRSVRGSNDAQMSLLRRGEPQAADQQQTQQELPE